MPHVSVILPIYNGEAYLHNAIESILQQTYKDFEFIIINDGSTDGSENIIASYADPRIIYSKQSNIGLTLTLNHLIAQASGTLLARMDQDDWSHPERLEIQTKFMQHHRKVKMCGSWIHAINESGQFLYEHKYPVTNHAIHEEMLLSNPFAHGSVMIRNGDDVLYRTEYDDAEDMDHWARQCMHHSVANLPKTLYHWRVNPRGISHSRISKQRSAAQRVLEYYREWYFSHTSDKLPPIAEILEERQCTGVKHLWKRKNELRKLFRNARRHDLVKREWLYVWHTLQPTFKF